MFNTDFFIFQYLFPITIGNILQFSQMEYKPKFVSGPEIVFRLRF